MHVALACPGSRPDLLPATGAQPFLRGTTLVLPFQHDPVLTLGDVYVQNLHRPLGNYPGLDTRVWRAIPTWEWLHHVQLVPGPRIRSNSLESGGFLRNPR